MWDCTEGTSEVSFSSVLIVSLFQALTQIQEMTLTFVPKMLAIFFAMLILFPYIGSELKELNEFLVEKIVYTSTQSRQTF